MSVSFVGQAALFCLLLELDESDVSIGSLDFGRILDAMAQFFPIRQRICAIQAQLDLHPIAAFHIYPIDVLWWHRLESH